MNVDLLFMRYLGDIMGQKITGDISITGTGNNTWNININDKNHYVSFEHAGDHISMFIRRSDGVSRLFYEDTPGNVIVKFINENAAFC